MQLIMNSSETPALLGLLALKQGPMKPIISSPIKPLTPVSTAPKIAGDKKKKENTAATVIESPVRLLRSMFPENCRRNPCHASHRQRGGNHENGFDPDAARAIRSNDVAALRQLLAKNGGRESFLACNRNGESLLHLACRRGNIEVLKFLIAETDIPVDIRDNLGRTILHDVCWRPRPALDMVDALLRVVPPQLLIAEDSRGHTPFDYVRRGDWQLWNAYLLKRRPIIQLRIYLSTTTRSS